MPKSSKEERYPSFSVYDAEAVKAIFGDAELEAGQKYDISPMRVKVTRVTSEEENGVTSVELSVVGVGTITAAGKRKGEDMEDDEEED